MKELKIEIPKGYKIDKEKSTFEKIVFKKVEKDLPETWEEMGTIKGWFTDNMCRVEYYSEGKSTDSRDKNLFPTEEEARASIALAQLCQLRDRYNGEWKPDWTKYGRKFTIFIYGDEANKGNVNSAKSVLAFKTKELRDKFLENFKDLIEIAKPLL